MNKQACPSTQTQTQNPRVTVNKAVSLYFSHHSVPGHSPTKIYKILHIRGTVELEKYLTFQTTTKVALISYMSDVSLSTAENKKINNQNG